MTLLIMLLIVWFNISMVYANQKTEGTPTGGQAANAGGHGGGHGGTSPETYAVLDLFAEVLHAHTFGLGVKITELRPKLIHIKNLYLHGDKHKAFALTLGVSAEVIMLGFFLETLGAPEFFHMALSFSDNWLLHLGLSLVGVSISTKAALTIGEKIEVAVEEKFERDKHAKAGAAPAH